MSKLKTVKSHPETCAEKNRPIQPCFIIESLEPHVLLTAARSHDLRSDVAVLETGLEEADPLELTDAPVSHETD